MKLFSDSAERTRAFGVLLGGVLPPGACVGLRGELGAGKTAFAAGLGEGLGVREPLRSPTYLLCCEHRGRCPVLHLDAYFSARMESLLHEGLASRFDGESVTVVEWADRLEAWWPADRLEVVLEPGDAPDRRVLRVAALGPRSAEWLQGFATAVAAAPESAKSVEPPPHEAR